MIRKEIGKISSIRFGHGGYQDAMIGISVTLTSKKDCWGCGDFKGFWRTDRDDKRTSWSEQNRLTALGESVMWLNKLMDDADVTDMNDLVGIPIEATFDGNTLQSWRILTEAI